MLLHHRRHLSHGMTVICSGGAGVGVRLSYVVCGCVCGVCPCVRACALAVYLCMHAARACKFPYVTVSGSGTSLGYSFIEKELGVLQLDLYT